MKLGATPIDDEEELWCFHGCAVQMMELPYLCDSAAGRGGGSCGASGAGCTPGACSSASSRRFGGDDAAFVVGGGGDNAPDKAPPVLATDSPPRSGAASPASLQPAEPEAAEGGAVEGREPHVPPPTALAEAVEGIEDANRCGRSVAEAEISRLLQLVGQVAAPLAGEAYPRWDHLICDALAEDEPPAGCPSPSKRTVSALALQYCRELLDRCRSSPAAVTLFKATASSGTFAPSATNSGGGGDGEPGARGAAAPAAAAAEHRPLPPAPAPVPLPGTEFPVPARSAVVREVAAQRGDPDKLRVVVDALAGAAEPRKRVGVALSYPSPSPSGKAGTFGKQAAASPAGPGPGSRTSPEAGEDQWGYAGAKFEARVVGCWWPVQVVEPAAFQLKMRKPGLKVKVAYAQDATDTWWVDSATGLRLKEDGKWSDGLAQCLRSVGRCQHRGCLAAMQTIARNEDPAAASPTDAAGSAARPLGAEPGREAEAAPQAHPAEAIPLERVDSAALHRMLCFLDGQSLAVLACTCSTFRTMAADDAIWRHAQLRHHRHPVTNVTVEGAEQTWHETYMAGVAVDLNWRRRRCNKTEWNDHSDHLYHVHQVGDLVITASADHTLRVFPLRPRNMPAEGWDADMGEPRRTVAPEVAAALRPMPSTSRAGSCLELAGHIDHVTCCSTLDAGRLVISAAVDDCLKVWELPSGKCVATQRGVVGRGFCKFTLPDWSWSTPQLVCASMSGSGVRVWDMAAWEETAQLGHAGQEFYSVCTPAGSALVLGAAGDSQVHVWDARRGGAAICTLEGSRRGSVRCVDAADNCIVSGGADGTVRVFDARMWGALKVLRQHTDLVNTVRLDPKLGLLVSGGDDSRIAAVQLPSWRMCNAISTRVGVLSLAFDHSRLVAACEDNVLRCWDFMVDSASYMDTDAWSTVARMVEARLRPASAASTARAAATPGASQSATAAAHFREGLVSPGAGYPHMNGFHT